MNQNEQMREALLAAEVLFDSLGLCGAKEMCRQALATEPAPLVRLTDEEIEIGAKELATLLDYPWDFMPGNGRHEMRCHVQRIFEAMQERNK